MADNGNTNKVTVTSDDGRVSIDFVAYDSTKTEGREYVSSVKVDGQQSEHTTVHTDGTTNVHDDKAGTKTTFNQ